MLAAIGLPPWLGALASGHARWVACALLISGMALGIASRWALGASFTPFPRPREGGSQVHRGPYRWVRHPFYVSFALAMLANTMVTANWFVFATAFVVFLLLVLRTGKEEEKLIERFGEQYRRYVERTGRFWPRFHGNRV